MKRQEAKLPDTNTILRYLLKDQEDQYRKAAAVFEDVRMGRETAVILESVLVECVYILTKFYAVPREETATVLARFLGYKGIINEDREDLIQALRLYGGSRLDIVDAILHTKAKSNHLALFTFDKALDKQQKD
jgi:predicted nucleic-acid-binding protein